MPEFTKDHRVILRYGMEESGAASADWADATTEDCTDLESAGLLVKTHRDGDRQFWRTTAAGIAAMGVTVQ